MCYNVGMQVHIGQRVRVKRGAYVGREGRRAEGNNFTGTVRQVWRPDRQAQIELDQDGARVTVALRDLRAPKETS